MHYDVAIIGAGEAGVFAGYELMKLRPELSVLVLEQGADIYSRQCPIVTGKVKSCIGCKKCEKVCPQHLPISQAMKEAAEAMGV